MSILKMSVLFQGYGPGMDGHGMGAAKTKRARTSFKHHQLRIMKAHFQINQNPDSRELKMLSQKTGLDKKVLQVRNQSIISVIPIDKIEIYYFDLFVFYFFLPLGPGQCQVMIHSLFNHLSEPC